VSDDGRSAGDYHCRRLVGKPEGLTKRGEALSEVRNARTEASLLFSLWNAARYCLICGRDNVVLPKYNRILSFTPTPQLRENRYVPMPSVDPYRLVCNQYLPFQPGSQRANAESHPIRIDRLALVAWSGAEWDRGGGPRSAVEVEQHRECLVEGSCAWTGSWFGDRRR
jgi:hypothetical protein